MAREMKDSGIEWIGEIPREWDIRKLKYCSEFIQDKYSDKNGELEYIGLENISSWSGKYISTDSQYDRAQSLLFQAEDILWGKLRPYLAKVYHTKKSGCCSSEFCVIRVSKDYSIRYFWNLLISSEFVYAIDRSTYGTKMPRANAEFIRNTFIPVPDKHEQQAIADFLDTQCAHIDSVIEKTRAAIEEYKKLKQAVITQAVTKGIRPNREMKDSGIEWFPVIPMEWTVSRVGLHYDIILGKMLCQNQLNNDYTLEPYYCAANVHFDGVSNTDLKQMWFSTAEKEQYLVKEGDLLVVEGGAGAGGSAIVVSVDKPTYVQNSVMIVRPKNTSNNCYLRYLLEFLVKEGYIEVACNKATIPHFTKDKLANVPYLVSNEQSEIVAYLDEKTAAIDSLVQKKEQLISELEAYKKSLIYEYVTGKKEVPVHAH